MRFTIIIPTFNRPEKIRSCLNSISQLQTPVPDFEVIVVDDGSTPPLTLAANQYPFPLQLLRQPNQGPGPARNLAASQARGQWLAFTDDDCAPSPSWLQALQTTLTQHPDALVGGTTSNQCKANLCAASNQILIDAVCHWFTVFEPNLAFFPSNNFACDRQRFLDLGGFNTKLPLAAGEDREFCQRWSALGGPLIKQPAALLHHSHPQSLLQFTRMHFRYGRGAAMLHAIFPLTKMQRSRLALYQHILSAPLRELPFPKSLLAIPLLAWSQFLTALGFLWQSKR
jgi:GT2 family glycosyltransferase